MQVLISALGMVTLMGLAYGLSENRRGINWRTVIVAFVVQFGLGALVLYSAWGRAALKHLSDGVYGIIGYGRAGIDFMFGELASSSLGFIFAFNVLPVVVFFASFVAVLYHLGIMQWIIRLLGGALRFLLQTSRAESLSATANIFVGHTEAPMVVKPYLPTMTRSELFAVMVGGLSTVAGSVLAGYVGLGVDLKYLLAASFMAAPGGFLMAKLMVPETQTPCDDLNICEAHATSANVFDAAATGASDGLRMAANIGAMLLAFVSLIAMLNGLLSLIGGWVGMEYLSMQWILGGLFRPLAFLLGVPWDETRLVGSLIGQKLVLNEFVAFIDLAANREALSARSEAIASFALCGFANFGSLAVLLGGFATLAPTRRAEVASLGLKAVFAGFFANMMSAAIASIFVS
ncbi:NupC/NupG family nucleoside CNT transporter [Gilvimarinus sp. SDUM040013]|uniref:Nucleoside permease n=1 Tax=Gilvimarinus gilvus TaxID=3058038 RepID=A0ABU4S3S7_9GAMM|nr:NupC/NupG family nucleoside CNT transporter [Gilvimarinus sp. SDUM040013]MDO3388795.1 NupC/NupG family nucleoside CNT transporter [Gilvimarinus sp. SDUM040013]MDX6850548.1 NupC/NupG family nucleoside CNT transporter [Gilvimarinus sp. SDUM040013]